MVLDLLFILTARWRRMKFFQNFQENGTETLLICNEQCKAKQHNATWPHWKTHKFQEVPIKVRSTKNWNFLARISPHCPASGLFFFRPLKSHFFPFKIPIVYTIMEFSRADNVAPKRNASFVIESLENWVLLLLTFDVYLFGVPQCQIDHLVLHTEYFLWQKYSPTSKKVSKWQILKVEKKGYFL